VSILPITYGAWSNHDLSEKSKPLRDVWLDIALVGTVTGYIAMVLSFLSVGLKIITEEATSS